VHDDVDGTEEPASLDEDGLQLGSRAEGDGQASRPRPDVLDIPSGAGDLVQVARQQTDVGTGPPEGNGETSAEGLVGACHQRHAVPERSGGVVGHMRFLHAHAAFGSSGDDAGGLVQPSSRA
jgi:hypothetical protein